MAYCKEELKPMAIKHLLVSNQSEQEMCQANVLLPGFCWRFNLDTF